MVSYMKKSKLASKTKDGMKKISNKIKENKENNINNNKEAAIG